MGGPPAPPPPIIEPEPAPEPVKTVIQSRAIKGTIANAIVTVYKYVDGQAVKFTSDELETIEIITELDGSYAISILDYIGPVKIELSVDENTTMMCDAPAGCGEVTYGEPIALATVDPSLVLSAISTVGSDNGEVPSLMLDHHTIVNLNGAALANINVSALTHLAAALIEADDSGVSAESIQTQSSLIANAFNIMGSLTQLEPTAIEDAIRVAGEDNANELRYGLINAGIMSALFSGEQNANGVLSGRLAEVVEDLIAHDGALLVNQDEADEGFELSLVEVLDGAGEAAVAAAEAIAADSELASQDNSEILGELEQQETNLENQSEYEEANEGEDGRSEPEVEVPTEGDAIAKAKAMVDDVRLFSHLFEVGTDSNAGIANEGDKYITLIGSASVMVEAEAASFLLLADVTDAVSEMSMMFEAGTIAEGTFPIDSFLSIEGAVGSIKLDTETDDGGMLFTISATSAAEKVALNAAVVFAEDGLSLNLNFDGSIESAGAMLSLTEGSFAKVNLDSAISRVTLEDDSYDGEVTSGELSLEVVLEQKATDSVTNPVAFTGLIKTKLMPISVPTLHRDWQWNESTEQDEMFYNQPVMETIILPEMLTLSGGFSSFEGNLIKATLTVNIQNLDSYEAPSFEYIGKKVENLLNINVSEDLNTVVLTEAEEVADDEQAVVTHTFTSNGPGEWTNLTSKVTENSEVNRWGTGYEWKRMFSSFDTDLDIQGFIFTYAYIVGRDSSNYYARSIRVTPIDRDNNGVAENYQFERISTYDGTSSYNIEGMRDDEGNIQLNVLVNDKGQILTADGEPRDWNNANDLGIYYSIDYFHYAYPNYIPVDPFEINNGAQFFTETNSSFSFTVDNLGKAELTLNEEQLENLAAGEISELNPTSYITKALIKDAVTVVSSDDENTVTSSFIDNSTTVITFAFTVGSDVMGNFETSAIKTENDGHTYKVMERSETNDIGLDIPEVIFSQTIDEHMQHYQMKITPRDNNADNLADWFDVYYIQGDHFTEDNVLVGADGKAIEFQWAVSYSSYSNIFLYNDNIWQSNYDPLDVSSALDIYKKSPPHHEWKTGYVDGIGHLELNTTEEELSTLTAGSTEIFDALVTRPDSTESLENEDVFLDASAALSLEAILGDYQVKLMLSGNRTALNDGEFDLEMSYKLPDDENMRKFIAHMKTDEAGSFSVNNSEGVLLIMNESNDTTSDVIGSIVVGSSATKVADIEDRDGVIWIVYSDETTETL